jgi:hypothetical protein
MFRLHKLAIFRPHMNTLKPNILSTALSPGYYLHSMIYKYIIEIKLKVENDPLESTNER